MRGELIFQKILTTLDHQQRSRWRYESAECVTGAAQEYAR